LCFKTKKFNNLLKIFLRNIASAFLCLFDPYCGLTWLYGILYFLGKELVLPKLEFLIITQKKMSINRQKKAKKIYNLQI